MGRGLEIPLWKRHAVGAYIWQLRMPRHEVAAKLNLTRQSIGLMLQRAKEHTGYSDDLPTLMDAIAGKLKADAPMVVRVKQGRPRKNPLPLPLPGSEPLSRLAEAERAGGLSSLMDALADRPMVVNPKLGGPRKTPLPGSDPSLVDDLPVSMDAVADTTRSDGPEAVKRKPGRPRKTPLHASDPSHPTEETDDLPILMEAIAVKPKRGRPRKKPLPGSESSFSAEKAAHDHFDHRISDAIITTSHTARRVVVVVE
jgi:hypothetical protein